MLVQETAVNRLNPFELAAIKHRGWRGSGHGVTLKTKARSFK